MKKHKNICFVLIISLISFFHSNTYVSAVEVNVGKWRLVINETNGKADIYNQNTLLIADNQCSYTVNNTTRSQEQLLARQIQINDITDAFGSGKVVTISARENSGIKVYHRYYLYDDKDYILTEFSVESTQDISSNYLAPVKTSTTTNFLPHLNNKTLFVPFDNDRWVRYKAVNFGTSSTSYEVGLVFNATSKQGLVLGSIEHDTWKTGIVISTNAFNDVKSMEVYGGITSEETRDVLSHGKVKGKKIKSPKIFIGYFDDWRVGMETYGDANAIVAPKLPWNKPKPFGWNSWGALQTNVSYTNSTQVADYIHNNLQNNNFCDTDGLVYMGLDSYWDRLTLTDRIRFVKFCKARGQKGGIYWTPFVDWAKNPDRLVEGSSDVYYRDIYLYANGQPIRTTNIDAYAVDPTHPASKKRAETYISQFKLAKFEYLKLDFLTHGSLEADTYYDDTIYTGIQAYNQGLKHIVDYLDNSMYINFSIAPLFPAHHAHGRRIACDAYAAMTGDMSTEYTLNSLTYGWWLDHVYNYNDADNVVLNGVNIGENRARITSSVITGIFIIGDDYSETGPQIPKLRAPELLTKPEISKIVHYCKAFRPVESAEGDAAADMFITTLADTTYVASFNYTINAKPVLIDFDKIDLTKGTRYVVHELWTNTFYEKIDSWIENLPRRDVRLFKIYPRSSSELEQVGANKHFSIFPNPASNELRFNLENNEVIKSASVYSLIGNKIKNLNVADTRKIPIDDLAKGTYIVKIESDRDQFYTSVFVKK
jgi:alpha-galactosidase